MHTGRTMDWSVLSVILLSLTPTPAISGSPNDVTVHTTHGDVRGQMTSVVGKRVTTFWGIPYAKIPARFQRAEKTEGWKGVLDASTPPPSCPEVPYTLDRPVVLPTTTPFEENCLYLNIWLPKGCSEKADGDGLAIMVWIHGGALQFGSTTVPTYNGRVLAATQCVIVASINYRLGALGFLSLGTSSAPGNVGMLDQVMALEWIHQNARNFGGSPDRITIFGESAGGLSVAAHMASPLSRGLFSGAIIQSGCITMDLWDRSVEENAAYARKLGGIMGCPVDNDEAMIRCLSGKDSNEMGRVLSNQNDFRLPAFGFVVDNHFIHKPVNDYFADKDTKKLNVMIGTTKEDGSFLIPILTGMHNMSEPSRPVFDQQTFRSALKKFIIPSGLNPSKQESLIKLLEYIYISSSLPDKRDDYHTAVEKILADSSFFCPVYATVASLFGTGDLYLYLFGHRSSVSLLPEWMGVAHGSEIDFVFGRPLDQVHSFTDEERQLSSLVMKAWANYAKCGNPNSEDVATEWPPVNEASYPYAVFRSPVDISIDHGWRYPQCAFWTDTYPALIAQSAAKGEEEQNHDEL